MQKRAKTKKLKQLLNDSLVSIPYDCDETCDLRSGELCPECLEWVQFKRQSNTTPRDD